MLVNGRYSSFSEVATAMGMASPVKKVDQNKQQSRQKKFCSYHKCKTCGEPMIFVEGTNIMTCSNPQCNIHLHMIYLQINMQAWQVRYLITRNNRQYD